MTTEFLTDILSLPTCSRHEDMVIEYIQNWAKSNGVKCRKDGKGNLALTKGSAEFYPCVTAHMDTVQTNNQSYVKDKKRLPLKIDGDKITCDISGTGSDCKAGIAICLSIIQQVSAIKACFFVEEEIGCMGSKSFDMSFFDNVGYVIGFDSPTWNRAAQACSGTLLFDNNFFEKYIKDIANKNGVNNFRFEPFTDVLIIRQKTELACMNFSNGGYMPHTKTEYQSIKDANKGEKLGLDLIKKLGEAQYKISVEKTQDDYQKTQKAKPSTIWTMIDQWRKEEKDRYNQSLNYAQNSSKYKPKNSLSDLDRIRSGKKKTDIDDQYDPNESCTFICDASDIDEITEIEDMLTRSDLDIDLDIDATGLAIYIDGTLENVREAFTLIYNYSYNKHYEDWEDYKQHEDPTEFYDNIIIDNNDGFDDDLPPEY